MDRSTFAATSLCALRRTRGDGVRNLAVARSNNGETTGSGRINIDQLCRRCFFPFSIFSAFFTVAACILLARSITFIMVSKRSEAGAVRSLMRFTRYAGNIFRNCFSVYGIFMMDSRDETTAKNCFSCNR